MPSAPSSADSPYIDAQGRTDAELYLMGVLDGSVVAGRRMKQLAEKMLPRIRNGYVKWHYDADMATRPVEFIETFLKIPSGKLGVPFILEPYERMIVELIFGFVDDDGKRQIQYSLIVMARKCGKTSLVSAILIYLAIADGEGAPQIYTAATSKGQASLAFGAVWRMVRQSQALKKYMRKGVVTERADTGIIIDENMGYIIPLSKQSDHLDGLDVHAAILDEMAAAEDRAIFDLIRQGTGAREQPLMLAITTNGFVRDGLFDSEHQYAYDWLEGKIDDDRFLPILFEQDDRSEVFGGDERMWLKSNPGLMHPDASHINGGVKSIEYLRNQVIKGKNDSSYIPTLMTKDFNIPANSATAFFDFQTAVNRTPYIFDPKRFRYCIVGLDAADSLDLNAATAIFMTPGDNHIYRKSMYWIAEEQVRQNNNSMRGRDGGVPYLEYASRGLLRIVPGNVVPRQVFVDWIRELAEMGLYTQYIGFDPWRMESILPDLKMLVGESRVEPVRQGARTYSDPLKTLKAYMRDGLIVDGGNSIDHMCNLNVAVKVDTNENLTVIKNGGPTSRIDGFMALLDAFVAYLRHQEDYKNLIGWYPEESKSAVAAS